ncbi:MAG: DUF3667 domain-containing protein [Acidobacteria bacterium]|nr:DUF3667 domain-containing protein [Acidobacteriota bacterium]
MATQLKDVQVIEASEQNAECPNCGAEQLGEYCHACGQKKIHRHDLGIKHFFGHVIHEFTHLDSNKILRTFTALLFKPGHLTAEYLAGRKGSYINPIRIYLTFSALYFVFAWGVLSDVRSGGQKDPRIMRSVTAVAKKKGVESQALAEKIYQKAEKYSAAFRFASVLVSGLLLTLLYYGSGRYYVEHLVFSLHYYSFDFFCKSVFALFFIIASALGTKLSPQFLNLFYPVAFVYLIFALRRAYGQGWATTTLKSVLLFTCETLLFMAVNIAGFIIAFLLA